MQGGLDLMFKANLLLLASLKLPTLLLNYYFCEAYLEYEHEGALRPPV